MVESHSHRITQEHPNKAMVSNCILQWPLILHLYSPASEPWYLSCALLDVQHRIHWSPHSWQRLTYASSSYCLMTDYVREVKSNLTCRKLFKGLHLQLWNKYRKNINLYQIPLITGFHTTIFTELGLRQIVVAFVCKDLRRTTWWRLLN